jgi:hypothetical protein
LALSVSAKGTALTGRGGGGGGVLLLLLLLLFLGAAWIGEECSLLLPTSFPEDIFVFCFFECERD